MQYWRLYTRYRCLPAARLHIFLASRIRAEKERRRAGKKTRLWVFMWVIMKHTKCQASFFCSCLKVNWFGEVKCSVVIPDISLHFCQLPVISVVRETETQLLPDVGAIVTCKVRSEHFQRFNKVVVFGFVWEVIEFSNLIRWPVSTPDTPRSTSCMWAPHRWRIALGGQSGMRGTCQLHLSSFIQLSFFKNWVLAYLCRKEDVRATEKDKVSRLSSFPTLYLLAIGERHPSQEVPIFHLAGGNV